MSRELVKRSSGTVSTRRPRIDNYILEDTRIVYPNFTGRKSEYNDEGKRNFNVVLTDKQAEEMTALGWNVRSRPGYEEGDPEQHLLQISIGFEFYPPKVYLFTENMLRNKIRARAMEEEFLWTLDDVDYKLVDVIIRPHYWEKGGRSGIKAWVQTLIVVIREDYLTNKYADLIDDSALHEISTQEVDANNNPETVDVSWDQIEDPNGNR